MKWMILIFFNFLFCAQLVGQVSRPDRNLLRGETYVIEVPKGWKRPSAVHSCNDEPLKRVNGKYETTKFMRVYKNVHLFRKYLRKTVFGHRRILRR